MKARELWGGNREREAYGFDAVSHEPMEALDEEEEAKHEKEGDVELITEYGESEERLCDEHPCLVVETLGDGGR